jgi:CRP/FNR family cyclic AMP-dependent transcriptional regulator
MQESQNPDAALRTIRFFEELSDSDLADVASLGARVSFARGDRIIEKGLRGRSMFVVLSGVAEVEVGGWVHKLRSGSFVGEMSLLGSKPATATVTAVDDVEALEIPGEEFERFLVEHPTVAVGVIKGLIDRLREVQDRMEAWYSA